MQPLTPKEQQEREARRAATRERILNDQATNAKRDEEALEREREWYRKNGSKK